MQYATCVTVLTKHASTHLTIMYLNSYSFKYSIINTMQLNKITDCSIKAFWLQLYALLE